MDSEPPKSTIPSSNITGIIHRLTKLCRLRSVGVSSGRNPAGDQHHKYCSTGETGCGEDEHDRKIHPQPSEESRFATPGESINAVISKLFDAISSLKLAYVQLQQAHIPYEPGKIRSADELVVSQLVTISEIEHSYTEKQNSIPKSLSALNSDILEQQCLLEKLQSQVQMKDTEILRLRWEIEELDLKNAELDEEIKRKLLPHEEIVPLHEHLNLTVFSSVFDTTAKSIHDFAKPLISLMKASGWDLDRAASSIGGLIIYAERSHKKYAFEAYLSRKMFNRDGVAGDIFKKGSVDSVMRFQDPFDALIEDPDSTFARFCRSKYLLVVHPKVEESFFGNLDQRVFLLGGRHPRTPFYRAFVKMARWVWVLRVMASSILPKAEIFCVEKGCEFSEEHMESVVMVEGDGNYFEVGFTVMPGFRIGDSVVKCKVYPSRVKQIQGTR